MALSGSFSTTGYSGGGSPDCLVFAWTATQDITTNQSTVSWTVKVGGGNSGWRNTLFSRKVTVGGSTQGYGYPYDGNYPQESIYNGTLVFQGQTVISHNADGTGSFTASVWGNIEYSYPALGYYNTSGSQTFTLDSIARAASITSAPSFSDQDNPVLKYSNPAGAAATLQAAISLDGSTANVAYRTVTGSQYTFSLTTAERNVLRNATTGATRTVYYLLKTSIGSNTFTNSQSATFTVANVADNRPTVSNSASPDNTLIPSTCRSNFSGIYVQNFSKAAVTVTASAKYSASITGYNTSLNGKNYSGASFTSDVITGSGTLALTSTVTDSRGYTNSSSTNLTVYAYTNPTITGASIYRCDSGGTASDSGTSIKINATRGYASVNNINKAILRYRYKASTTSTWGSWNTLIDRTSTSTNAYSDVISGTFAATTAYNFQISVLDDLGKEATQVFDIPTEIVTLHMKEGGKALGFGTYAGADNSIAFAWKPKFSSGSISEFSSTPPYLLGIESFASGGEMKWKAASGIAAGKLATARNIALGSDLQGNQNFDGSSNITINARITKCFCDSQNVSNYPWHRIATVTMGTSSWQDGDCILDIRHRYSSGPCGRIKLSCRTNNATSSQAANVVAQWIYRKGISENAVVIALWGNSGQNVYADVYYNVSTYARCIISKPYSEGPHEFQLINSSEVSDTTTSDKKSSYECYKTVAIAATELRGQAYTSTYTSVDSVTVGYATHLGSATVGAANQPIYLNAGTPTAATTVNTTTSGIVTRSGGLGITSQSGAYWGRVAQLTLTLNGDGAWHDKGSNIFTGTVASGWRPKTDIMGVGYYSDMVYTGWITSGGAITIRLTGYSSGVTFSSGSPVVISWTYLW